MDSEIGKDPEPTMVKKRCIEGPSIANRIGLIIGFMFLGGATILVVTINLSMRDEALINAGRQARIVLDRNLAIHAYFAKQLKPKIFEGLGDHIGKTYFEPEWMSSTYAVREINKYSTVFSEYEYYYKECAINARSPENEADEYERAFIQRLNADPNLTEKSAIRTINGSPFFVVLRRGEIMDESCLRCHSIPDVAPAGLIQRYGKERSFGRMVGEVVSAVSIRIPLASAYKDANRISLHLSLFLVLIMAGMFLFLYWLSKRLLFSPLDTLSRKAEQIASTPEHLGEEIPLPSGRELADLTASFNAMSVSLRQKMDQMEGQTSDLEKINRELKAEVERRITAQEEQRRAEEETMKLNEQLEHRVAERTAQLETANEELEAFSSSVSHDLRAPIRAIGGFARVIAEDNLDRLDDEGKRALDNIIDNTRKMAQLVEDLLAFSHAGRKEMVQSEIDVAHLARTVFDEQSSLNQDRLVKADFRELPSARGDSALIRQVFVNLLTNAFKFSRTRKVAIIEVGGRVEGKDIVYYVKDNGVGFDMAYAANLFGVFQRLHSASEFEGTGVGLALVQRIIHRHGGRVWAEGKVNEGATFYFTLPGQSLTSDKV